jgi:hypothetical protein
MAQNRTFVFKGLAYGNTPVSLEAVVGGATVFSGQVPTVDQETPTEPPAPADQGALFEFTSGALNTDFAGYVPMTITCSGGNAVVLGEVLANWHMGNVGNTANPNSGTYGKVDGFALCYNGVPTNSEGTSDIRSSVKIDGITQVPPLPASTGIWNWILGSRIQYMACNFNVGHWMCWHRVWKHCKLCRTLGTCTKFSARGLYTL